MVVLAGGRVVGPRGSESGRISRGSSKGVYSGRSSVGAFEVGELRMAAMSWVGSRGGCIGEVVFDCEVMRRGAGRSEWVEDWEI